MSEDASTAVAVTKSLDELYRVLPRFYCEPLWTIRGALTPTPVTSMVPHVWRFSDVRSLIDCAGDLITAEEADRRVLAFRNPGARPDQLARTTDTLWAAIQMVRPGEIAPPHRHTPTALRFIIEGHGAYTTVDGVRCDMEPGDFLITPNWSWHEHGHDGDGSVFWLDGLDLPLVHDIRMVFADLGRSRLVADPSIGDTSDGTQPVLGSDDPARTVIWKFAEASQALDRMRTEPADPWDDVIYEYRDPDGGPVLETMAAYLQLIRAGTHTETHRHTSSAVYHVVRGHGASTVGDTQVDWETGDTFAVPVWAPHSHHNATTEDALLFSFSDAPALAALGLLRSEA